VNAQFFEFIEYHSTCFGRSFRPSSGDRPKPVE